MASSGVAGDDAYPTKMPSRDVSLRPVIEEMPPFLRFAVGPCPEEFPPGDAPGFISSIDDALARYADEQLVQIEISLVFRPGQFYIARLGKYDKDHPHAALVKAHHVRAWLSYGMARAEESFVLEVPPCPPEEEHEGIALDLPASAVAETMALTLGNATLALPAPAEASFHNLTGAIPGPPSQSPTAQGSPLGIAALSLEAFTCSNMCMFPELQFRAPYVREIGELPLWTHGHENEVNRNKASIWILTHCTHAHRLHLHLHVPYSMRGFIVGLPTKLSNMVDYRSILVEEIPELPNVTYLTVTISAWGGHSYAASLARLIAQCVNLEELHIVVNRDPEKPACSDQGCVCNNESGWEHQNFSMEHLRYLDLDINGGGPGTRLREAPRPDDTRGRPSYREIQVDRDRSWMFRPAKC